MFFIEPPVLDKIQEPMADKFVSWQEEDEIIPSLSLRTHELTHSTAWWLVWSNFEGFSCYLILLY